MQILSIKKKKRIHAIAFSPSGRELAGTCGDGHLRVWDLSTSNVRQTIPIEETSCGYDLAYLAEDRLLFAGTQLRWWDIPANGWNTIANVMRRGRQLCLSPDGQFVAEAIQMTSSEFDATGLLVYDTAQWNLQPQLDQSYDTTGGLAFSQDGRWLASGHIVRVGDRRHASAAHRGVPCS